MILKKVPSVNPIFDSRKAFSPIPIIDDVELKRALDSTSGNFAFKNAASGAGVE